MRKLDRCILSALAAGVLAAQPLAAQEQAPTPRTHTVVRGDNLWDLSQKYLGNAFLWPEIYRLNRDVIEDPHWIYPGEVLRLPGEAPPQVSQLPEAPGITPPAAPAVPAPAAPAPGPVNPAEATVFTKVQVNVGPTASGEATVSTVNAPARPTVRAGEVLAAPYVDREGGPRGFGRIIKSGDIAGIAQASDRFRFLAYDRLFIMPPVGTVAPEGERYLAYKLGPVLEGQGQIVIPTGIIEITRAARTDTAAVAKVVKAFTELSATDRLIPIDTAGVGSTVRPVRIGGRAPTSRIAWVYGEPVLPSYQNYIVLNTSALEGIRMGDEFVVFLPPEKPEEGQLADPDILIAKAQVVRSTPYGVTAVVLGQEQPSVKEGMSARVTARMP
jgi:LysM repeat protein